MIDVAQVLGQLPMVFELEQARAAGMSPRVVERAVRRGLIDRLERGVFVASPRWGTADRKLRHQMRAQAAALAHPGIALSHHSAALVWDLPVPLALPDWVSLTTGVRGRSWHSGDHVRFEPGALPVGEVERRDGFLVTTPARTVADCFRSLPLCDAVAVGDAAVRRWLVTVDQLGQLRRNQRGWPFVTRLEGGIMLIDPQRENWFESYSFIRLHTLGVPIPTAQVEIYDRRGRFVARADGLWKDGGTVGEADGAGKYLGEFDLRGGSQELAARTVLAEKTREDRIRDLGLEVVRWDFRDITQDAAGVAGRVSRARERGDIGRFRGRIVQRPRPPRAA